MKPFINTKETLVHDALDGFLSTCGSSRSRLDGYPHIKVVIRTDWDKSKVALLSGEDPDTSLRIRALLQRACCLRPCAAMYLHRHPPTRFSPRYLP